MKSVLAEGKGPATAPAKAIQTKLTELEDGMLPGT